MRHSDRQSGSASTWIVNNLLPASTAQAVAAALGIPVTPSRPDTIRGFFLITTTPQPDRDVRRGHR